MEKLYVFMKISLTFPESYSDRNNLLNFFSRSNVICNFVHII